MLIWLYISGGFLLVALGTWFVFLRPVPRQSALGTITDKYLKPPGSYQRVYGGNRSGFYMATAIPMAECYVFVIDVEGYDQPVRCAVNKSAGEVFEVGQSVAFEYEIRGIPGVWHKSFVYDLRPVE